MEKIEERIQCSECEKGKLKAQVFYNEEYGNYSAYCFVHSKLIKDPFEKGKEPKKIIKTEEEKNLEIKEIKALPYLNFKYRDIPAQIYKNWGVRLGLSEMDGKTPYCIFYPYTKDRKMVGWKARGINKKSFWSKGNIKGSDPFGWEKALSAKGKRIIIVEGENDAISLDYCLRLVDSKTKFKGRKHAIISLANGCSSIEATIKKVVTEGDWKEIVILMDDDVPGKEAVVKAQKVYREVLVAKPPRGCKDANDAINKDKIKELFSAVIWEAKKPPIKGVITVLDVMERVAEKPVFGLSYPWDEITEITYGQRFNEVVGIGAGVGQGKTLIAHEMIAHNINKHDMNCFAILLEEDNPTTVRNIAGKIDSIPYHKPDVEYDNDKFMNTIEGLKDKLLLWQDDGDQYKRFDIDEIIKAIRFNVAEYDTKFVYIDNMTRLVDHLDTTKANEFINKYASELEGISCELGIHTNVFSHLNSPGGGKRDHESGGRVKLSQFTGSRGMMRSFHVMMGFERNKLLTGDNSSKSCINLLKLRKYGGERPVKTKYNVKTGKLVESLWEGGGEILETFK